MKKHLLVSLASACLLTSGIVKSDESTADIHYSNEKLWPAINLNTSNDWAWEEASEPVVIAIIDDGFATDHPSLNGFSWINNQEVANNSLDDDGNGLVDDTNGWDVADSDFNPEAPKVRRTDYFHGTFTASIIADVVRAKLGSRADYPIKFMYIKAVSDTSTSMLVEHGYRGIDYAISNGAHIINNSWDGGQLRPEDSETLNKILINDVFTVNSIGNFPSPLPSTPASHPAVFGVAGSDAFGVLSGSNYGLEVDITAPSRNLIGAGMAGDYTSLSGTSFATPLVSATAALMKLANRSIKTTQIRTCLQNSASLIDQRNPMIAGKVGAGLLNVDGAIECAKDPDAFLAKSLKQTSKGSFGKTITRKAKANTHSWTLSPVGAYAGITFLNSVSGKKAKNSSISFTDTLNDKPLWDGLLSDLPAKLTFDANQVRVDLNNARKSDFSFQSSYQFTPIDFEKRYCSERITINKKKVIEDGSGDLNYAALSDCEWLIEAREGHAISIDFQALDIEASDSLYLFSGDSRQQRNLLSTFSGNKIPARIMVKNGPALLWLVSGNDKQHQGFSALVDWITHDELEKIESLK